MANPRLIDHDRLTSKLAELASYNMAEAKQFSLADEYTSALVSKITADVLAIVLRVIESGDFDADDSAAPTQDGE